MDNKTIKKNRMMRYFIDATADIIKKDGVESVTVRKVADLAGYNIATLYNYFENLDHLVSMASLKFIKPYTDDLPNYLEDCKNPLCRVLRIWECFCTHAFASPHIYKFVFYKDANNPFPNNIKEFYQIYPEYLENLEDDILDMLTKDDIYYRALVLLRECVDQGYFDKNDLEDINEMVIYIYEGVLTSILYQRYDGTIEDAVEKTIRYIKKIFEVHLKKKCDMDYYNC